MGDLERIGIVNMAVDWWTAGASYTRMLVQSLAAAKEERPIELLLLSKKKSGQVEEAVPATIRHFKPPAYRWGERTVRGWRGLGDKSEIYETALRCKASVLLPMLAIDLPKPPIPTIGWIPDFQHRQWPEYYSKASLASRDLAYRNVLERSRIVLLSSESARADLRVFAPEAEAKARVVPFPSLFAFDPPAASSPAATLAHYHLPEKFALVANQFWRHKNHGAVVQAVAALREGGGPRIPVVMTGQPSDFRDPQNKTVSQLLQSIAEAGLAGQVIVLGQVPYAHLIALMRAAAVIIQPSQSEGWSTIVQDAKALGRPVLCSGIATHREQAPDALGFFAWDRPDQLAALLAERWEALPAGPDLAREEISLQAEREFARAHGRSLLRICEEALGAAS